jgi:hypothetical protein
LSTQATITFHEYNDETVYATLYEDVNKTTPLDLTGTLVEFIYKTSNAQSDAEAVIIPGEITDAAFGKCEFQISNDLVTLTRKFYRIDVIGGIERKTAVYGPINVVDL